MRNTLLVLAVAGSLGLGFGDLERGNRLYREGRYAEAVEAYLSALDDEGGTPALHYNLGTALLRLGRYAEAERHLRAALRTVEPDARTRTHYNLGNRFLEEGRAATDPQARDALLAAAVEAYKQALRIAPADVEAKWNLELALREREQPPPQPSQPQGQGPAPAGGGEQQRDRQAPAPEQGAMSREQAERILSAVEQDERELFREKLRKGRRETPVARDW